MSLTSRHNERLPSGMRTGPSTHVVRFDGAARQPLGGSSRHGFSHFAHAPKGSVIEALIRLIRAGHIQLIYAGGGYKSPSVYRLLNGVGHVTKDDAPSKKEALTIVFAQCASIDELQTVQPHQNTGTLVGETRLDGYLKDLGASLVTRERKSYLDDPTIVAVASLIDQGLLLKDIAKRMRLNLSTVKQHASTIRVQRQLFKIPEFAEKYNKNKAIKKPRHSQRRADKK